MTSNWFLCLCWLVEENSKDIVKKAAAAVGSLSDTGEWTSQGSLYKAPSLTYWHADTETQTPHAYTLHSEIVGEI